MTEPTKRLTLMGLWLIVRRYRATSRLSILAFAVLAGIFAFAFDDTYNFTTTIEIGNQRMADRMVPIEFSTNVTDKIENGYYPYVAQQIVEQNPDGPEHYELIVNGKQDSQIVTLVSEGPLNLKGAHIQLHQGVVDALIEDHSRIVENMISTAESELAIAEALLAELIAAKSALQENLSTYENASTDFIAQSEAIRQSIAAMETELGRLRSATRNNENGALSDVMLNNEIGTLRQVLITLDDEALVGLREKSSEAREDLQANAAAQEAARKAVAEKQSLLKNIQRTRAVTQALISPTPVGPNKIVILGASLLAGVFVAIAGALVLAFLDAARDAEREIHVSS